MFTSKQVSKEDTQNTIECEFIHPKHLIDSRLSINLDKLNIIGFKT